jgi:hypothetical protein
MNVTKILDFEMRSFYQQLKNCQCVALSDLAIDLEIQEKLENEKFLELYILLVGLFYVLSNDEKLNNDESLLIQKFVRSIKPKLPKPLSVY